MSASDKLETQPADQSEAIFKVELLDRQRLEVLLDIHRAILSTQDLKATALVTLEHVRGLVLGCRACSVVLLDPDVHVLALIERGVETPWPNDSLLAKDDLAVNLDTLTQGLPYQMQDLMDVETLLPLQKVMLASGIRSYLAAPLRASGELIGLLNLASEIPNGFKPEIVPIICELADALAVAVQQALLLESEQKRRREAEIMRDVMAALASSVNLNQALEVILRNLSKVVRYDRAALYMQNENAQFQLPDSDRVVNDQSPRIFPTHDRIIAELRSTKRPLVINDIQQDERFDSWPEQELARGWMGAPLFAGDEMIGILSLGDLEPGAYRASDAELVQMFTVQVADVLFRARLQETSSRRAEELELLTGFSFALRQVEGQENVLTTLMDQTTAVFGASRGTVLILEKDASALVVSFSQDPEMVGQWHAHGNDPLWQVVRSGNALFISDVREVLEKLTYPIYRRLFQDMQSAVLLPLNSSEETFGVLCFTFHQFQDFSLEDKRLFQAISEIAGTALRRAVVLESLEKQVITRTRHLSTLYEISAVASEPTALELLLERLLTITLDVLDSPAGAIHLLSDPPTMLNRIAQVALPERIAADFDVLPLTEPFWRNLLRSSEPAVVPDLKIDPRVPDQLRGSPYRAFVAAPIRAKGQSLGLLTVMGESMMDYTIEDITLLTTIAENIGSTVERARLQKQAERAAVAEERQRLARELHDSISQLLYSLVLYAGAGRKVLNQGNLQNTSEYLRRIDQTSQQALKEMRLLVYELRPSVFREEGLVGALNRRLQAVENRTGMNAQLLIAGEIALDEAVELALYRITEEALNNTLKHAEANQVVVSLSAHTDQIDLEIWDNGKGFNLTDGKIAGGLGLTGIQERVSHFGGQLDIQTSSGKGTRIHVHLEVTQ